MAVKVQQYFDALFKAQSEFTSANLHIQDDNDLCSTNKQVQICPLENSPSASNHASKSCRNLVLVVLQQN